MKKILVKIGFLTFGIIFSMTGRALELPHFPQTSQLSNSITAPKSPFARLSLATGSGHTCALLSNGTVKCWGQNNFGQLGFDTGGRDQAQPTLVPNLSGVLQITAGSVHTCALITGGIAKCWGGNFSGQLGDGTRVSKPAPTTVSNLSDISSIQAGTSQTCAIAGGNVSCWGKQVLHSYKKPNPFPLSITPPYSTISEYVDSPLPLGTGVSQAKRLAIGINFNCALLNEGKVACWGNNELGQLGLENALSNRNPVFLPDLENVIQIDAGPEHACAVLSDHTLKCWGSNHSGQLGLDSVTTEYGQELPQPNEVSSPTTVPNLNGVSQVAAGGVHTCALLDNGQVQCWGDNNAGQIGNGKFEAAFSPNEVNGLSEAKSLSSFGGHTCAVLSDVSIACWGLNENGQLGIQGVWGSREPVTINL